MSQQDQTHRFFRSHAKEWQIKAEDSAYSMIQNRHFAVFETMRNYPRGSSLLDVGCGTGQLAVEASSNGWVATGIDFAEDMIEICRENNKRAATSAEFICGSIFDFSTTNKFDVVSAQGFIEYISLEQLDTFLAFVSAVTAQNGSVAIGSRNRLFNIHSMNHFTRLEQSLGTINSLIEESIVFQTSDSQLDVVKRIEKLASENIQPEKHPLTGIGVDTRYQFTPSDLATRLKSVGFSVTAIYPVHLHPFPINIMNSEEVLDVHNEIARFASEEMISEHRLVPYSSSYVIEAVKR